MMTLDWITCGSDDHWCALERVALDNVDVVGVYLIWHEGMPSRVVKIGRGRVAERLAELQQDPEILSYRSRGTLRVTWASAPASRLEGIVRYLVERWRPPVLTLYAETEPIEVNAPWKVEGTGESRLKTPLEPRTAAS